jgi:CPA1 family monovalent cation:H+ antiporter
LFFIVIFGVFARQMRLPYPIVMVLGGLALSFIPGIPKIALDPDLVFLVVLPPLLYASAWTTSWRDFRFNLGKISLLAVGLVGFTVIGVSLVAPHVFPGFDRRLGLVLGAVVAPTDAIAATSIARRVGLPARIVDILEGESLLNDATGLLALQFAIAIVVQGRSPTWGEGILTFSWLTIGGVGLGLIAAWMVDKIERRVDDGPIEITLSILVPYAVYLAADAVRASGVLAVVACGLYLSRRSADFFSAPVRIQVWSVWASLTFVLNGLVFVLIGLQLPSIRASIAGKDLRVLVLEGAAFSVILIVLRLAWVFPGAGIASFIHSRLGMHSRSGARSARTLRPREVFVVGWTGMRGVVSLAAALALPVVMADGSSFPQRSLIVFLTFCVILVTLILQGLTLPPFIRWLGLAQAAGPNCEELEARRIVIQAAVSHLEAAKERDAAASAEHYDHLTGHYHQRLANLNERNEAADYGRYLDLSLEAVRVERQTAIRLRNEGRINDEVLRRIERELDLEESRMAQSEEA